MADTSTATSSSSSSPSSSPSAPASSSEDEPPRNRRSRLTAALMSHTPLLPPLIHITLSYLTADRLAILDGQNIKLTLLQPTGSAGMCKADAATSLIPLRGAVSMMHLHLDGRLCTTGVKDKLIRLHATLPASVLSATPATSVLHLRHVRHDRHFPSVSCFLSLDAKRLLIGFDDGSMHCYNTRTGAKVCGLTLDCGIVTLLPTTAAYASTAHSSSILSPAVSVLAPATISTAAACTTHVIVYTTDHAFRLIDVQLCRVAKYIGRIGYVHRAFASDGGGGRVAVCGEQSVFVWRLYTWTCERTVNREEEEEIERQWIKLHCLAASDEERKDGGGEWETKEQPYSAVRDPHFSSPLLRSPTFVCPLWSSAFLACAYTSGFVHVWRVGVQWSQRLMCSFHAHDSNVQRVQYAGDGRLVTSGQDGKVRVWQIVAHKWERSAWRGVEEELEEAERWHVRLLGTHDMHDSRRWNGVALVLPGD